MYRFFPHFILLTCFSLLDRANAQTTATVSLLVDGDPGSAVVIPGSFQLTPEDPRPWLGFREEMTGQGKLTIRIRTLSEVAVSLEDSALVRRLSHSYPAGGLLETERHRQSVRGWFSPLRRSEDGTIWRLVRGEAQLTLEPDLSYAGYRSGPDFKTRSVLAEGRIHKVDVERSGIYKLDYNFFKDKLKADPATLNVQALGIYGNGGGRVPQANAMPRIDDLEPCSLQAIGLEDGQFNPGDYLLWYGEGPDAWTYDPASGTYQMEKNIYDTRNHYYILLDGPPSPHMIQRSDAGPGDYTSVASLEAQRLEEEKVNLLGRYRPPGSGQDWYGDELAVVPQIDYTSRFDFRDLVAADSVYYKLRFAIRAATSQRIYLRINEQEFNRMVGGVNLDDYERSFANNGILQGGLVPESSVSQVLIRYPAAAGVNSRAWVDYLQLNFWRQNHYRGGRPLIIRDPRARYLGVPTYRVDNLPGGAEIWDVTDPQHPVRQGYSQGPSASFTAPKAEPDRPAQFLCFDPVRDAFAPEYMGPVSNQDLHGLTTADLVILYADEFREAAEKLATHRRSHDGYEVVTLPTSQVFEEFGGGSGDPSAIRDFARMLYERDPGFNFLLFIGDATYDYLGRDPELPVHNYVPAFETEESLDPIRSFPADDFYALLDDQEGGNLIGAIDIAVGRLPVSEVEEAGLIVDKIIHYETDARTLGDWRNRVVMVADDQDGNIHLGQADNLANITAQQVPLLNQEKIYLDAYPQESTPGGDRYPAVNDALDRNVEKGALTVTYMGHGGPNGWTQERVLGINQAQGYSNLDNLPLFITATCSFAGYDEPGFVSAGEHLLVNSGGGAIGLMTTVRAVFSGSNARLTEAVIRQIYKEDAPGYHPPIGEVLRRAKNDNAQDTLDTNARKFTLLGDPSMHLAFPRHRVAVTQVGQVPAGLGLQDTLSALEKTTVSGVIQDKDGNLIPGFQGRVYLTVFDKVQKRKTLGNDVDSPVREFQTQNKQLFKGTASVVNGHWTIGFVLPKDIDFAFGNGKMSLYAEDGTTDASGYFTDFVIGGVSGDGLTDDDPPLVRLYMNDDKFVSGGITDANPDIYVVLSDDNGINVSGTSIGHDITAILDDDNRNALILNEYYQAAQDDYRNGFVRYPLRGLAPGRHTLRVTAWDLANNPGQDFVEFIVRPEEGVVLTNLGCDPNPFTGETRFRFEHNRPGSLLDVEMRIFNLQGGLVRTLELKDLAATGYRVNDLVWDGSNQTGAQVPNGLYVYRLRVTFRSGTTVETVDAPAGKVVRL